MVSSSSDPLVGVKKSGTPSSVGEVEGLIRDRGSLPKTLASLASHSASAEDALLSVTCWKWSCEVVLCIQMNVAINTKLKG